MVDKEKSNNDLLNDLFSERKELLLNLFKKIEDFDFKMYNDFESLKNVILIDSPFGTGKTFFAKKLEGYLEKNNIDSIYFDAWENDYEKEPFIVISKYIFKKMINNKSILKKTESFLQKNFFKLLKNICDRDYNLSLGINTKTFKAEYNTSFNPKEFIDNLKEPKDPIVEFKEELQKLINELKNQKLVLIIDELDRCRPDYAMKLLEVIKHFFNIEGLIIIVFENKKALNNSIKSLYNFDNEDNIEENYTSKFFIEKIKLSPINYEKSIIDELCSKFNFKTKITKKEFEEKNENISSFYTLKKTILDICNLNSNISCRDLKSIIDKIIDFYNKINIDKIYNDWKYIIPEIFKKYFLEIKGIECIEGDRRPLNEKKPYFYLFKGEENNISFMDNNGYGYFKEKYEILNIFKYTTILGSYSIFIDKLIQENRENFGKILFGFFNHQSGLINESKTFKEYFKKAKERIKILKNKEFSNIYGFNTKEIINELIKIFQNYDKKVKDFKNKYGDTDGLTEDDFKNARLKINETINKIFFINN